MPPGRAGSLRGLAFGSGRRNMSPGPPSPTFSDTTHASAMNFGAHGPDKIITRSNLKASLQAYDDLVNSSAAYRAALIAMSKATGGLADAMERCSGLKGPTYEAGTRLQAAAGVHHLIGNLWHVLSESLDKNFERPLRQQLEAYRTVVTERSQNYEKALREKSHVIRETEMRSMNRKQRNLQSFREALSVLQRQVDELDALKLAHYQQIVDHEEEIWDAVQNKVCVLVRSEMDVFDRVTAKASDPVIEPMLQCVPDPFDSYGPPQAEDQIFSILAPLSIMTGGGGGGMSTTSSSPMAGTPDLATRALPASAPASATNKITSWLPAASGIAFPADPGAWAGMGAVSPPASAHSPPPGGTPPRATSPASPQPSSGSATPRRNSAPPPQQRKATAEASKLRAQVLLPIDESTTTMSAAGTALPPLLTSAVSMAHRADALPDLGWNFTYGQAPPYEGGGGAGSASEDGQRTPRSSTLFATETPLPPDRGGGGGGGGASPGAAPDDDDDDDKNDAPRTPTPT